MNAKLGFSRRRKTNKAVVILGMICQLVNWAALVNIVKDLDQIQNGRRGGPPISFELKPKMLFAIYS